MSPPRGWKKQGEEEKKKDITVEAPPPAPPPSEPKITITRKKEKQGPTIQPIQEDKQYAQIVISWTDDRGRPRTTRYTMFDLNVAENISEEFTGAKKKTRISLNIDGTVLEKL